MNNDPIRPTKRVRLKKCTGTGKSFVQIGATRLDLPDDVKINQATRIALDTLLGEIYKQGFNDGKRNTQKLISSALGINSSTKEEA